MLRGCQARQMRRCCSHRTIRTGLLYAYGTFACLDNEPQLFQHTLPDCSRGDQLLLDMQLARGSISDPSELKKRDKKWATGVTVAEAAWLRGPIWRHCKDVAR